MFKACLTVCILVEFVLSCHAKSCCYPDQVEGTYQQVIGWVETTGKSGVTTTKTAMSFDALGKRIYIKEDINVYGVDKNTETVLQLQLYEKGVQYTVINKTCIKEELHQWIKINCVPDYAVKMPPFTLGIKPNIKVQEYYWKDEDAIYTTTVTSDTCVPVLRQYVGNFSGAKLMGVVKFENVTTGIKDPHVFDVPDICKHKQVIKGIATQRPMFPF